MSPKRTEPFTGHFSHPSAKANENFINLFSNFIENSYRASNGVSREETVQITNEGTPEQDVIISGKYLFTADDGYRYVVKYSYDKNGSNVIIDQFPVRRIPPNALKSLIG